MAAKICRGCDYYRPLFFTVIGRECAAFRTCVEVESCGLRTPPLPRDENGRQIVPEENEELEEAGYEQGPQKIDTASLG
jgi:hypothetical protein